MAEMNIQKQEAEEMEGVERTRTRRVFIPRVDIYETDDAVILLADMPGVNDDSVDITLEKNILTVTGYLANERENYGLAYREYREGDYERTFALSDEVDRNQIEATMKDGVLKLTLPKAEEMKARKITVKSA
jgi:HSP20 family molecular chaperone IbpA